MAQEIKRASGSTPRRSDARVAERVREIIDGVRPRGDEAVREFPARFDGWEPETLSAERTAARS
ncbi:hypothetical protein [Saccharopolyspora cebuensis]|uniref:Histidinol dehydrogenase n=1 Tax=Saccharopolyspora cebuensis TaxID=418759 RepID=A0ABV4CHF9_9PSEU